MGNMMRGLPYSRLAPTKEELRKEAKVVLARLFQKF
jgi:hypothetical protein